MEFDNMEGDLRRFLTRLEEEYFIDISSVETIKNHPNDLSYEYHHEYLGGITPFYEACQLGHLSIVKWGLSKGINPNVQDKVDGWNSLHHACSGRRIEIVKLLLEYNTNVNTQSHWGHTPLHVICRDFKKGDVEIVKLLLDHGADVNLENCDDETPISLLEPDVREQVKEMAELIHLR